MHEWEKKGGPTRVVWKGVLGDNVDRGVILTKGLLKVLVKIRGMHGEKRRSNWSGMEGCAESEHAESEPPYTTDKIFVFVIVQVVLGLFMALKGSW